MDKFEKQKSKKLEKIATKMLKKDDLFAKLREKKIKIENIFKSFK